jgi:hypothetical protein
MSWFFRCVLCLINTVLVVNPSLFTYLAVTIKDFCGLWWTATIENDVIWWVNWIYLLMSSIMIFRQSLLLPPQSTLSFQTQEQWLWHSTSIFLVTTWHFFATDLTFLTIQIWLWLLAHQFWVGECFFQQWDCVQSRAFWPLLVLTTL